MLFWQLFDFVFLFVTPVCIFLFLVYKIAKSIYLIHKLDVVREIVNLKCSSINTRRSILCKEKEDIRDIIEYVNIECNKIDGLGTDLCKNENQIHDRLKVCYTKINFFLPL